MTPRPMTPQGIVASGTVLTPVPYVPEISLLTAARPDSLWELWMLTGQDPPPFWAFPWAGGQGLARYVLDHPRTVAGLRVFDAASGSGLVAIAAAKAGAAAVTAGDIDHNALAAIQANADHNGVALTTSFFDLASTAIADADVVLAADVFYQRDMAAVALDYLRSAAAAGADVLVADPGRAFRPAGPLIPLASYPVPVLPVLEDATVKTVTVYRVPLRVSDCGCHSNETR